MPPDRCMPQQVQRITDLLLHRGAKRKRRTLGTSSRSLHGRPRRQQRQWCFLGWFRWLRCISRCIPLCRTKLLGIIEGMDQNDSSLRSSSTPAVASAGLVMLVFLIALCSSWSLAGTRCSASWPVCTNRTVMRSSFRQWYVQGSFCGYFAPRAVFFLWSLSAGLPPGRHHGCSGPEGYVLSWLVSLYGPLYLAVTCSIWFLPEEHSTSSFWERTSRVAVFSASWFDSRHTFMPVYGVRVVGGAEADSHVVVRVVLFFRVVHMPVVCNDRCSVTFRSCSSSTSSFTPLSWRVLVGRPAARSASWPVWTRGAVTWRVWFRLQKTGFSAVEFVDISFVTQWHISVVLATKKIPLLQLLNEVIDVPCVQVVQVLPCRLPVVCNDRCLSQLQFINKVVHTPVVAQSLIPMVQTVRQTIEIPHLP